jgi:prepilin-type N-terminal cleavage/methylation domain-containing protein
MSASMKSHPRRSRGFSLVELMIALVLGLIVVGGLIQVLISNRTAYRLQESSNFLQQNLRYGTDRIGWSLRMADFWGGPAASAATITGAATDGSGASGCDDGFARAIIPSASGGGGVFGYDGGTAFPIFASCITSASNYVKGSDVLVVRYADTDACALTGTTFTTVNCLPASRYYLTSGVGGPAVLTAGTGGGTAASISSPLQTYVYPLRAEIYYLRPCSNPGAGGCTATSDGGTPIPTLMRMRIDSSSSTMKSEPIVEGVEQLQFEYGLATQAAPQAVQQWLNAKDLTATTWPFVIAVRVSMVTVARQRDTAVPSAYTFNLTKGCTYSIAVGGTPSYGAQTDCTGFTVPGFRPDQFPRKLVQQVFQLRNRTRGVIAAPGS